MYKVKQTPDKKAWIVIDETGFIANNCKHPKREQAEIHLRNIEAFSAKIGAKE